MTALQAVGIPAYEERSDPKPHTVYQIEVKAHVRSWLVWRRYSEFDDLDEELSRATGSSPPAQLPSKHTLSLFRSHSDPKLLEERKAGLETYLRAIVSSKDEQWRECYAFKQFLGVPVGKQGALPSTASGDFSPATWLDEHTAIQDVIRDIRADINKRDALLDRSDGPAAHKSNLEGKKKLAKLLPRTAVLAKSLQQLGMKGLSEGELQRRTDMVAKVQNDCEGLAKMVHTARFATRNGGAANMSRGIEAPEATRNELLQTTSPTKSTFTRIFGSKPTAEETEETRPLDDQGLLGLQQTQMHQQDDQLSQLTTILQRQRQLGQAIHSEIAVQNEELDGLTNDVDRVSDKIRTTDHQMRRLG